MLRDPNLLALLLAETMHDNLRLFLVLLRLLSSPCLVAKAWNGVPAVIVVSGIICGKAV